MKQFHLLDVCYPDYFTGYHRPVVAVPVHNNMKVSDLADGLEYEMNSYDYSDPDYGFSKTERLIIEEFISGLYAKGNDEFIGNEFEEEDEFSDCAFAYFSIIKPVFKYGQWFLNE